MTIFKTIQTYKTDAQPVSFWKQGLFACLSLGIGTIICPLISDMTIAVAFERIFFQSFSIIFFCFIMSRSYILYPKKQKIEHEFEIKEKVKKEATFNF